MRRSKFRPTISANTARRSSSTAKPNTGTKTAKDGTAARKEQNKSPEKVISTTTAKAGKDKTKDVDVSDATKTAPSTPPPAATTEESTTSKAAPISPTSSKTPTLSTTAAASTTTTITKSTSAATSTTPTNRRRRAAAVPNLGRPRVRASQQSQSNKESGSTELDTVNDSVSLHDPPTVTRVTENFVRPAKSTDKQRRNDKPHSKPLEKLVIPSSVSGASGSLRPPPTPTRDRFSDKRTVTPNIHDRRMRDLKDIEKEQETPAKRRKRYVKTQPPDRSKMTMSDLIYYNPKNNPMKSSLEDREKKSGINGDEDEQVIGTIDSVQNEETADDVTSNPVNVEDGEEDVNDDNNDDDDDAMPVPQVRVSEDGTIVINEASLLVEASPNKSQDPLDSEVVYEKSSYTTSASFRKRTHTATWTERETAKFYRALSSVGTDFSLINAMFPNRTRNEIKNKFKREERSNRVLVDKAITERQHFDMSMFEQTESDIEAEKEKSRKKKAKENKKERGRRKFAKNKKNDELASTNETSIADGADHEQTENTESEKSRTETSVHNDDDNERHGIEEDTDNTMNDNAKKKDSDVDSDDEIQIVDILSKPTRSGRQPKLTKSFTIEEPQQKRKRKLKSDRTVAKKSPDKYTLPALKLADKQSRDFGSYTRNSSQLSSREVVNTSSQSSSTRGVDLPTRSDIRDGVNLSAQGDIRDAVNLSAQNDIRDGVNLSSQNDIRGNVNMPSVSENRTSSTNSSTQEGENNDVVREGSNVIASLSSFGSYVQNSPVSDSRTITTVASGATECGTRLAFTYIFPETRFKSPTDNSGNPCQGQQNGDSCSNYDDKETECESLHQSDEACTELQYIDNQLDDKEEHQMMELLDAEAVVTTSTVEMEIATCSEDTGPFIPPTVIANTKGSAVTNVINTNMSDSDSND
ncbi:uncharacterized protein LOC144433893 [Glandiceps talaboti]